LHDIIQASFDWYDGHLHEFRSGGYQGTSYGPEIEEMEYDEVEDAFLVSELLKAEKDRLDYAYDFGDGWEVRIDVEKVLDSAEGQLPRCTGGRRMAPIEDSGGPWGWAEMLKAMNDSAHAEHGEVSEWFEEMGMDEIDPAAFSIEEINEALELEF
ncbi:MAG TPA: plasmid pRiA4b ORF-3 family protein, partial [Micrococcaceae bacterium]|nr:plasmid pRiA4b ORF-3 family protein [Micrococcaceae bacterium]